METKVIRKFFMLPDFIEEEEFLMEQHALGWRLVYFNKFNKYIFEKCKPANYVYQLDYKETSDDDETYLQLFEDCGWEYLTKCNNFYYFRSLSPANENNKSLFSDMESKLAMVKKISKRQGILSILSFLPISPIFLYSVSNIIVALSICSFYVFVVYMHARMFLKLKRLMASLKG